MLTHLRMKYIVSKSVCRVLFLLNIERVVKFLFGSNLHMTTIMNRKMLKRESFRFRFRCRFVWAIIRLCLFGAHIILKDQYLRIQSDRGTCGPVQFIRLVLQWVVDSMISFGSRFHKFTTLFEKNFCFATSFALLFFSLSSCPLVLSSWDTSNNCSWFTWTFPVKILYVCTYIHTYVSILSPRRILSLMLGIPNVRRLSSYDRFLISLTKF